MIFLQCPGIRFRKLNTILIEYYLNSSLKTNFVIGVLKKDLYHLERLLQDYPQI